MESHTSASWYRVADQRPRLAREARFERHVIRGAAWFVIQSPTTGRVLRLSPEAHAFARRLDGGQSVADAFRYGEQRHGDDALSQDEAIAVLSQLHGAGLLRGELPADAEALFRKASEQERKERRSRRNPIAFRVPLFDPDAFLTAGMPFVAPLFSRIGGVLGALLILLGGVLALEHAPELAAAGDSLLEPSGVMALWFAYPFVKALHELGHGFAVKRYGGEVHEMGLLFLVFIPVPYVDASASAVFPEKGRRMLVAALGILVELGLASLALFLWLAVEPGFVKQLAYAVMLVGGVSTLFFNGNPLLRFDGYYVFSDAVEIPNLASRARAYLSAWARRRWLGLVEVPLPETARGEAPWLVGYALASSTYQLVILFGIAFYLAGQWFFLGVALALFTVVARVALPLGKGLVWLATDPLVGQRRGRAWSGTALLAGAIVLLVFALPLPLHTRSEGVTWLPEDSHVRSGADGFVVALLAEPNRPVKAGDPLLRTRDPLLEARLRALRAERRELAIRVQALAGVDPVRVGIMRERLADAEAALLRARQQESEVLVVSPSDGVFVLEDGRDPLGRHVRKGAVLGYVVDLERATVRVAVPHEKVARLRQGVERVAVRLAHDPGEVIEARIAREVPSASDRLPSPLLGTAGGGSVSVDPADPEGLRTLEPVFQFELALPSGHVRAAGAVASVRFSHGAEPVAGRMIRALRRTFLRQLGV
ncbi:MAG: efflux RND transporter periplasmic adaptor subunit [Myxococcota bacterium]|nr:efflux RND transporter periplasmic adaptor subunit [Myxococcota bacterium]